MDVAKKVAASAPPTPVAGKLDQQMANQVQVTLDAMSIAVHIEHQAQTQQVKPQ